MKRIAAYHKGRELRMISHLDVQRTLQRAFRRAGLPLAYSNGFNPHPLLSFATAAATGMSSECEWFEVQLSEAVDPDALEAGVNAALPNGMFISGAFEPPEGFGSLAAKLRAARYEVELLCADEREAARVPDALADMLKGEIIVDKRTKSGVRPADIRPHILEVSVEKVEGNRVALLVLGRLQADGGLRVDSFVDALLERSDAHASYGIHRAAMFFAGDGLLPRLPAE